jgi:hypothetical protein
MPQYNASETEVRDVIDEIEHLGQQRDADEDEVHRVEREAEEGQRDADEDEVDQANRESEED